MLLYPIHANISPRCMPLAPASGIAPRRKGPGLAIPPRRTLRSATIDAPRLPKLFTCIGYSVRAMGIAAENSCVTGIYQAYPSRRAGYSVAVALFPCSGLARRGCGQRLSATGEQGRRCKPGIPL